jgi:Na+/citrate or Na+/malate symporter
VFRVIICNVAKVIEIFSILFANRLNKIGKQNPRLGGGGSGTDNGDDDDGSPDMTALVSALANQQQQVSCGTLS